MAKKQTQEPEQQQENLPVLSPPRLPYHPAILKEFGVDIHQWKVLVEAIWPAAQSPASIRLALSYCKARKLDPLKRVVHIVPIWDPQKRCLVDTVWPGIGELRTTAHRTGLYAGREKTEFGPMVKQTWGTGGEAVTVEFPEWAQVIVYRMVKGARVSYAGPQVYWLETYGSLKNGTPNSMWHKRPRGQIDKCAEAAALRAAFPEEVGNEYIDAEAHLARQVESREVEKAEAGNEGLKKLLAEREAKANGEGQESAQEQQTEDQAPNETESVQPEPPEPVDEDLQDPQTQEKVAQQKEALGVGSGKKSNLF